MLLASPAHRVFTRDQGLWASPLFLWAPFSSSEKHALGQSLHILLPNLLLSTVQR